MAKDTLFLTGHDNMNLVIFVNKSAIEICVPCFWYIVCPTNISTFNRYKKNFLNSTISHGIDLKPPV